MPNKSTLSQVKIYFEKLETDQPHHLLIRSWK